jgi:hypothetical protein
LLAKFKSKPITWVFSDERGYSWGGIGPKKG